MFSHALQHGLLRSKYCITLQSIPYRPPQLRCVIFPSIHLPHLHSIPSDSYWASVCLATLPGIPCLICSFCPSDQRFAIRLPSDSTSRWTPLSLAVSFLLSGHFTDLHRLDYAHAGRTTQTARTFRCPGCYLAECTYMVVRLCIEVCHWLDFRIVGNITILLCIYIQIYSTLEENDTSEYVDIDLIVHMMKIEFSVFQPDGIL